MRRRTPHLATGVMLCALLAPTACSVAVFGGDDPPPVRIAFLQDLTVPSHVDLVSPSFLAFDLAVHDVADPLGIEIEVVQMDTEGDAEAAVNFASQVVADPTFVLAVAAPFWSEPPQVASMLAEAGVPTLSLSPLSPSPWSLGSEDRPAGSADTLWRRLVPDQGSQAASLAAAVLRASAAPGNEPSGPVCIFSEDSAYSRDLRAALTADLQGDVGLVVPPDDGPQEAVDAVRRGCGLTVWTGSTEGAADVSEALGEAGIDRTPELDLGPDALKTVIPPTAPNRDGVVVGALTCPCVDVSTARDLEVRRFINAYQSANGLAPGIYAAESWDAAGIFLSALRQGVTDRDGMQGVIGSYDAVEGVAGTIRFDAAGDVQGPRVGLYAPFGTRWLALPS
jgi:branched-chain amino acid transport system substrate-binding protein